MATHEVRIDRSKTLAEQPGTGHNRWHPDITPLVYCEPGDEVVLETRDALDGQITRETTTDGVGEANLDIVHPLTGPVYIRDAEPGDLLEVQILDVEPEPYGFTVEIPGFGFLRDYFPEPFKVDWDIADGWATSGDLLGVRIPGAPFMGTIGLAPGAARLQATIAREQALLARGGVVLPPSAAGAVPTAPRIANEALRTIPPREQGGNVDIKQLVAGTRLLLPVDTAGALFSAGDAHFAQGDCETCGTAIEIGATVHVRFELHKGEAAAKGIRDPRFSRDDYFMAPEYAVPRRFFATTGIPIGADGENRSEDLTLAAHNALLNMIDHLGERGWSPQQAYAICSVAVDLRISQVVDLPNVLVSAFLPEDIFVS
jgi:formamidase